MIRIVDQLLNALPIPAAVAALLAAAAAAGGEQGWMFINIGLALLLTSAWVARAVAFDARVIQLERKVWQLERATARLLLDDDRPKP